MKHPTTHNSVIVKPFEVAPPLTRHNLLSPVKEQLEENKYESTSMASRPMSEFEKKAQNNQFTGQPTSILTAIKSVFPAKKPQKPVSAVG